MLYNWLHTMCLCSCLLPICIVFVIDKIILPQSERSEKGVVVPGEIEEKYSPRSTEHSDEAQG